MSFQDFPIKRKLVVVIMLTSVAALVFTAATFMVYELVTYRRAMARDLGTTAAIIADNSTAALAFQIQRDAAETLGALRADPHIEAAALYDHTGKLFAQYPGDAPTNTIPPFPGSPGYRFENGHLIIYRTVAETEGRLGTLYIRSDLGALNQRMRLYAGIVALVLTGSILVAFFISESLQRRISNPLLALTRTARLVSEHGDYSVRAEKVSGDELGVLTDSFNVMLKRIQEQTRALKESEKRKTAMLDSALDSVITLDEEGQIVDFNPAAEKVFGRSRLEVVGKRAADIIVPESCRAVMAEGLAQFRDKQAGAIVGRRMEMKGLRAGGQEFPVELAITPTVLEDGGFFYTIYLRDISERKRAEESVSLLAAIVESSDDAIIGKDLHGKILSWNAGAERMFGYASHEMIGQPVLRIVAPDRPEEEHRILTEVQKGEIRHYETVRIRKDGHPIEVSLTVSPIRNAQNEIVGASSIARDTTARNRAQRALRGSETQLRLIWENVLDGMRLVNEEGTILRVNDAYCRLVGKARADLEGFPLSVAYPPDRAQAVIAQHRERFIKRTVERHFEREITIWNEQKLHLEISNSFLEISGEPPLLVSIFRDILERKQGERREAAFARLARSLSAAASATAAARIIADTALELMGWDAFSLDLYDSKSDRITPIINIDTINGKRADVPPAYGDESPSSLVRQVLAKGAELILRQDASDFSAGAMPFGDLSRPSASLMFVPIRLGQKTIGVLSIQSYTPRAYRQSDLSTLQTLADQCSGALERVRVEEEVRQINAALELRVTERTAELRAANKEMEAFTYSVAHDLRAPLRHINAFTRILREDFGTTLAPEATEYLDSIQNSSQNMSRLVDDLLNLARVGRQELKRETTALTDVVRRAVEEQKLEAPQRAIEWRIQPLPVAQCDPGLIRVVFTNLLSNAVKYTRPRTPAVIEVGSVAKAGRTAIFVRDNGVGFDMSHASKLFGVFQRLHRVEEFEGTGVGLATVERIVRKHGGTVWAEAEPEKGATFYFTLGGLRPLPQ